MSTKQARVWVTKDPALAEALDRAALLVPPSTPTAKLVHDLAIRGAEAILADEETRKECIEKLIENTTGPNPPFDREVLANIDRLAWGIEEE